MKKIFLLSIFFISFTFASSDEIRIINGSQVLESNEEWRSIVSLKWQNKHYCGGTLIAPTWVLTAAHCLVDNSGITYIPEAGDTVGFSGYNLNNMQEYGVKRFIVHASYNARTNDNDIALVELENTVTQVNPTHYDTENTLANNTQTKVAGWGNISTTSNNYPDDLREALVPLIDRNICNGINAYDGEITSNMLCAGYMISTRDSCQGDSGGPLIIDETLVGIVSWGRNCAQDNFPGVYTKVQNYETWIKSYTPYVVLKTDKNISGMLTAIFSVLLK